MNIQALAQEALSALLPGHNDATRMIRLHTTAGANAASPLLAERLEGVEQIGPAPHDDRVTAGFRFTISALSTDASLAAADWLGKPALIDLLTSHAASTMPTARRPLHGHITAFERLHADGGFGYYALTIEPWLAFLAHRRDSFVFHDMSVIDIVDNILGDYAGSASLVPEWRWALADAATYPKRSICTQYNETDLAFIERLLAEEGLYYWFEHAAQGSLDSASHTLVIADHNDAFGENAQARVRFHRANATEADDTIQTLALQRSLVTQAVEIASWDYRTLDTRTASARSASDSAVSDMPLTRFDAPGAYVWPTREAGERYAARQIEALEAQSQLVTGSGTVRTFAPGSCFTVEGHFDSFVMGAEEAEPRYAVLRVQHTVRNNLAPALSHALVGTVFSGIASALHVGRQAAQSDGARQASAEPLYTNTFTLLPAHLPYRPIARDERGVMLRPRPTASGAQSAIVVGEAGQPVHTDRDGRIRVQFHWQRGGLSHSRLAHPSGSEDASGNAGAWSWVRVMTPWAGANWGSSFIPRVGQEVLVEFIEGDIDRPVVVGGLYNGQGAGGKVPPAQNNQTASDVGVATGNAPAWFAGESNDGSKDGKASSSAAGQAHAHPATLAGIKTQAMSTSRSGAGGFNQLVFDLTPTEPRTQLATTQFATALNLGAIRHQQDNQRLAYRGHGTELVTQESGALRAGSGLLLSTDARQGATGTQMDARLANAQLEAAHACMQALAESAQKQKADLPGDAAPDKLPALEAIAKSQEVLEATETQQGQDGSGGSGTAPAWSAPMMVAESPAGIGALTPKDAILNAGSTLALSAQDIHIASQGKQAWAVKDGIALYTYGKQSDTSRPVADTGLKLHAAKGKVSIQAQSDKADFNADKKVTVTSTTADVLLQGKNELQLTAAGAAIQISGGNITLTAPGKVSLLAGQRNFTSGKSASGGASLAKGGDLETATYTSGMFDEQFVAINEFTGEPLPLAAYRIEDEKGVVLAKGTTDAEGRTARVRTSTKTALRLLLD